MYSSPNPFTCSAVASATTMTFVSADVLPIFALITASPAETAIIMPSFTFTMVSSEEATLTSPISPASPPAEKDSPYSLTSHSAKIYSFFENSNIYFSSPFNEHALREKTIKHMPQTIPTALFNTSVYPPCFSCNNSNFFFIISVIHQIVNAVP